MIDITRLLCGQTSRSEHLRYRPNLWQDRRPVVVWNCTRRCNLRCVHCYSQSHDKDYPGELTTAEAKALIDDLAAFKVPVLLFSGGEPLLRKDLFELAEYAIARGLRAVISTNGTLISADMVKQIKRIGFNYVGVSLDGLDETNDRFRGKKGAFQDALQGIRNCRDGGVKVGLRFTVNKLNVKDLPGIFDLLVEENIPRCCVYHLVYAGRGSKLVQDDLTHEESRQAVDLIFQKTRQMAAQGLKKEVLTVDNYTDAPYLYLAVKRDQPERADEVMKLLRWNGGNSSGVGIGCVDNLGHVHADQFWSHYSFGNVRERKFSAIWMDTRDPIMAGLKHRKPLIKGRCAPCQYFDICNANMRVRAEAVYGDVWAQEPACYLTDQEIGAQT